MPQYYLDFLTTILLVTQSILSTTAFAQPIRDASEVSGSNMNVMRAVAKAFTRFTTRYGGHTMAIGSRPRLSEVLCHFDKLQRVSVSEWRARVAGLTSKDDADVMSLQQKLIRYEWYQGSRTLAGVRGPSRTAAS